MTLRRSAALCGLLFFFLALLFTPPCPAQGPQVPGGQKPLRASPEDPTPYVQRTDAFRRLLSELGFQPLRQFQELQDNPGESMLIVLGDPRCLSKQHFPRGLRAFVEQGGALLVATDMKTSGEAGELLSQLAGVVVTGDLLLYPNRSAELTYSNSEYCPFVQQESVSADANGGTNVLGALASIVGVGSRPDLFRNPRNERETLRVATNTPSRLQLSNWWLPAGIHRLAVLPSGSMNEVTISGNVPGRRTGIPIRRRPVAPDDKPLFAVGGSAGKGRVLVLADHSIFINRMMLPKETGNFEFAANSLHWLRGGVSTPAEAMRAASSKDALKKLTGQRNKVLFWDDGKLRTNFEVPLKTVPIKPTINSIPALVAAFDRTVTRLEEKDFFNRKIVEELDLDQSWGRQRALRYVVGVLTLMAALLVFYRFVWRSRFRPAAAGVPLLSEAVSRQEPTLSWLEQRRQAVMRSGNVWETAHRLVREGFESLGIPLTAPPRILAMQGGWRQRWRMRRRLLRLWRLARGDASSPISPAALNRWLHELEELKTALAEGTIRLT